MGNRGPRETILAKPWTQKGDSGPLHCLWGATFSKIVPRCAAKTQEDGQVQWCFFFFLREKYMAVGKSDISCYCTFMILIEIGGFARMFLFLPLIWLKQFLEILSLLA